MQHKSPNPERLPYQLTYWARLLAANNDYLAFELDNDGLVFLDVDKKQLRIDFLTIDSGVAIKAGWFWDALVIKKVNGEIFRFGGVDKKSAKKLQPQLNSHIHSKINLFNQKIEPTLNKAVLEAEVLFFGQRYIRRQVVKRWRARHQQLFIGLKRKDSRQLVSPETMKKLKQIEPVLEGGEEAIQSLNLEIIERETQKFQAFFDQIESNPLTESQRRACVIDEQHNLVLAGAGTGKTSTMIGRAGYLLKTGLAGPGEILMLA